MKKVHLIKTGLNGSQITATAVIFNEENEFMETQQIWYNDTVKSSRILEILGLSSGEVYEYFIGGRPNRKKK